MRIRTTVFGVLVFTLALSFMFVSCDSSVDVRDDAAERGVGGGRGPLVGDGIEITFTGVGPELRYDGQATVEIWRFVDYGDSSTLAADPSVGRPRFPPNTNVIPPRAGGGTATGLLGIHRGTETAEIEEDGTFSVRFLSATVGNHLVRVTIDGEHVNHHTATFGRIFVDRRVGLGAYNSMSIGAAVYAGTTETPQGDPRDPEGPETPGVFAPLPWRPEMPSPTVPPDGRPGMGGYNGDDDDDYGYGSD